MLIVSVVFVVKYYRDKYSFVGGKSSSRVSSESSEICLATKSVPGRSAADDNPSSSESLTTTIYEDNLSYSLSRLNS